MEAVRNCFGDSWYFRREGQSVAGLWLQSGTYGRADRRFLPHDGYRLFWGYFWQSPGKKPDEREWRADRRLSSENLKKIKERLAFSYRLWYAIIANGSRSFFYA